MSGSEANFDGLVGPTHHYAGLSFGNEASTRNQNAAANPKLAAKQGLLKMKALADLGFAQGVLPPHERPHLATLRQMGFGGSDREVLAQAQAYSPRLLSSLSSASSMWVANAATVSPSADSADGRTHFTVANLNNKFHRTKNFAAEMGKSAAGRTVVNQCVEARGVEPFQHVRAVGPVLQRQHAEAHVQ